MDNIDNGIDNVVVIYKRTILEIIDFIYVYFKC